MTQKRIRIFKWAIGALAILLVVLVSASLLGAWRLGPIVKHAVETMAPDRLGVPVTVKRVSIKPFRGRVEVQGLVISNPDGFQTPTAFDLGELILSLDLWSLRSDVIHIRELRIRQPRMTVEMDGRRNNVAVILAHARARHAPEPETDEQPAPPPQPRRPGRPEATVPADKPAPKRVKLDRFVFEAATVTVSARLLGPQQSTTLALPTIEMRELGHPDGLPPAEIARQIGDTLTARVLEQASIPIAGEGGLEAALRGQEDRVKREIDRGLERLRGRRSRPDAEE